MAYSRVEIYTAPPLKNFFKNFQQNFVSRPNPPSSVAVFLSWHCLHSDCQLFLSQNKFLSPLCGMIWSTTAAGVYTPRRLHSSHSGCALRKYNLAVCHLLLYPRRLADGLLSVVCKDLCLSQYLFSVNAAQPGCLHGFNGLYGITHHTSQSPYTKSAPFRCAYLNFYPP